MRRSDVDEAGERLLTRHGRQDGQVLVLAALMLSALLGLGALAIDVGRAYTTWQQAQNAADMAAWAAGLQMQMEGDCSTNATNAIAVARYYATQNGYTNGTNGATVSVTCPYSGDNTKLSVTIGQQVTGTFTGPVFSGVFTPQATGVAQVRRQPPGSPFIALGTASCPGISINGAGTSLAVSNGGIVSNAACSSTSSCNGMSICAGSGSIQSDTAVSANGTCSTGVTPTCSTLAAPVSDPLQYSYSYPCFPGTSPYNGCADYTAGFSVSGGTHVIGPGVYTEISASGGATIYLKPGIYILRGGSGSASLTLTGGSALKICRTSTDASGGTYETSYGGSGGCAATTTSNAGVMIFNTVSGFPGTTGTCRPISLSGGGTFDLAAQTSGSYQGLVIWQDPRTNGGGSAICDSTVSLSGGGSTSLSGTVYAKNGSVALSGGGGWLTDSAFYAKDFTISGGSAVTVNYNSGSNVLVMRTSLVD